MTETYLNDKNNKTKASQNYIVVIGSKPKSFLPNINPKKIYTANLAIERLDFYLEKNSNLNVVSVVGNNFFNINYYVEKLKKYKPKELITTNGRVNLEKHFETEFVKNLNYRYLENKGRDLQKKYFNSLIFRVADLGLIFTNKNLIVGFLRFIYNITIKRRKPMGLTTGCLTILLALSENVESKIIVAGIGLEGGKHYYRSNRSYPDYRGWADAYLMKHLPNSFKNRLETTDLNVSRIVGIKLLKDELK